MTPAGLLRAKDAAYSPRDMPARQGAVMINCRSPVEEFHSLRRQSFHGFAAVGRPREGILLSWLLEEGGQEAG